MTVFADVSLVHVAVIGSGPSGFYAAQALLESDRPIQVDMYERLPVPFGLVRHGVAPDHQKLKEVTNVFQQIAEHPRFSLLANVEIGGSIDLNVLRERYHAVVIACGASSERKLDIPGEDLSGVHAASDFVGWYNGHPAFQHLLFDLSQDTAVVVGNGNVALDVCRILAKSVDELRHSDITEQALDALAENRVREIHLIGRRGPAQAQFTTKELREFGMLEGCDPIVCQSDLALNEASQRELASAERAVAARNMAVLQQFGTTGPTKARQCHFRFGLSPREAQGGERLERIVFDRTALRGDAFRQRALPTGEEITIRAGLLFRSIGYRGTPLPGVGFDADKGIIPNEAGRILGSDGSIEPGLYVTGWIKRGPSGTIGTNRACAFDMVGKLLADLPARAGRKAGQRGLYDSFAQAGTVIIGTEGWTRIDAIERTLGQRKGKPREKFTRITDMLAAAAV